MHVNAQKELLALFNKLCESNGQLVYTTHLPYMLDTENIYCIRRVEKMMMSSLISLIVFMQED